MFLLAVLVVSLMGASEGGDFRQDVELTWGDQRGKILDDNRLLTLSLDNFSGSGFQSNNEYLLGRFDIQIKLVPGNSAGTVTTYYLSSPKGLKHDEIDMEFLGNVTGESYILHTNVYSEGIGNREQEFYLWFDPTGDFHSYSIVWNRQRIIFLVDNIPIRVLKNLESLGVPFPKKRPMRVYSSLWNADDWATQGGRVKADRTQAPFVASYRNFNANGCVWASNASCNPTSTNSLKDNAWQVQAIDAPDQKRLRWARQKYMIYNYRTDQRRFLGSLPTGCQRSEF